jgi:hypothetical protein
MTYWKIQFTDGLDGFGWCKFDDQMVCIGVYDEDGNEAKGGFGYTPIEFDTRPSWDNEITLDAKITLDL